MSVRAPIGVSAFVLLALVCATVGTALGAEQPLTLEEAIRLSLRMSEGVLIQRESFAAAEAAVSGAKGAYDPFFGVEAGWRRANEPVISAFSGAPPDRASPTSEVIEASAGIRQLLPTGGALSVRTMALRGTTDAAFDLLSPAYGTRVGVELRQPLLRDRAVDAARLTVRQAGADRKRSLAALRQEITETVAVVERVYWRLLAAGLEPWRATVKAIGTVEAAQGVIVSADLPGIVEKVAFESGRTVRAGDVLVRLDASQERSQLAAAEAQRDLAHLTLERMRELREKGVISQAEYDRTSAESRQAEARVSEIRATIERKTIRAPFDGVLGIRRVNLGQHLTGGDPVVPLQARHPVYVNFAVPQQQVGDMRAGAEVRLTVEGMAGVEFVGSITATNAIVDETTRNVQVQATFDNPDGRLRPGMFVEAQVLLPESSPVVALPASAIRYAPYGDAVFVVQDIQGPDGRTIRGVRQQFVKLGGARGDQVAVLAGVSPGDEVVTSGVFKLRNGAAVQVNNGIQPANDPAPKPEDG